MTPAIAADFYARSSYAALARQYWPYGLAKVEVLRRHPARLRPRHLVPSAFVLSLAGGALLTLLDRRFGWLVALSGGAYVVANTLATVNIARRGHGREAPYLPLAFATIHLSAGAGMLFGALRTLLRRNRRHRD
jgi:hypothetical protein